MKTSIEKLLEIRARLKSKRPRFLVQDAHKRGELPAKWRKPRGVQSKLRLGKKGRRKKPSQGFRSPRLVRGLHKTGLKLLRVCSLKELDTLPKGVGIIISSKLGHKKRLEIIKKAEQLKIKIVNIKPEEFLKRVEKKRAEKLEKKEEKGKKVVKKEKKEKKKIEKKEKEEVGKEEVKKEEEKKKEKEEKKEEKELTEEERKETEKKEKDKLLSKRVR